MEAPLPYVLWNNPGSLPLIVTAGKALREHQVLAPLQDYPEVTYPRPHNELELDKNPGLLILVSSVPWQAKGRV